ncbi:hypothetical protein [Haloarcula rubra]|nr:hypothetical protein [Halomicroarcula rubra]
MLRDSDGSSTRSAAVDCHVVAVVDGILTCAGVLVVGSSTVEAR